MNIRLVSQPAAPQQEWLGMQLRALLSGKEGRFDKFKASVAFAKVSGVSRIYAALKVFRAAGATSSVSVGIDQRGTSKQALNLLRTAIDEVFVYHDISPGRTFHPKIYVFERVGRGATVLVGSGNLTAGGLFSNYEAHLRIDLDLTNARDRGVFEDVVGLCDRHTDLTSPCVRKLTDEALAEIEEFLLDEAAYPTADIAEDEAVQGGVRERTTLPRLFGTIGGAGAPAPDVVLSRRGRPRRTRERGAGVDTDGAGQRGFWKMLSKNDVSASSSPGQIIIPIGFRGIFPDQRLTHGPDAGGKGRQWEASFVTRFQDGTFLRDARESRFIVYEPKAGHRRPNTECRFTFRNRDISTRLRSGDILIFTPTPGRPYRLLIERLTQWSERHRALHSGARGRFGTMG